MHPALLIIAQQGYQDVELDGTRKGLVDAGFSVVLASTEAGECTGKFGGKEQASVALRDVDVRDYDRIAFIGGPGAGELAENIDAKNVALATVAAKIPLGAICIAPTILAAAGVLKSKRSTVWDDGEETQISFITRHGATYVDQPVVVDGLIVTGNGPKAAGEFGKTLVDVH